MAFDGVPIGIGEGLPEEGRFCLSRYRVSGCPGLENALSAVEMVLVPSDRKYFDSPACLPELVPKLPVGLAPAMERASGGYARIDVGEDGAAQFSGLTKLNPLDYTDARLERVTEALGGTAERANWNSDHYGRLGSPPGSDDCGLAGPGVIPDPLRYARQMLRHGTTKLGRACPLRIEPSPCSLGRGAGESTTTEI